MNELTERINTNYQTIAKLTDQIAQLIRERDELQKKVWEYEKRNNQKEKNHDNRN